MIILDLSNQAFEFFLNQGYITLCGDEPGFDAWEQQNGLETVLVCGIETEVFIEGIPPRCSCCSGMKPSYEWIVTLL